MSSFRGFVFFVLGCCCLLFSGCNKADGSYRGLVQNQSHGVRADLFLTLRDSSGIVTGNMTIGAPLYGGGAVMGRRDGSDIQFTTGDGAGGTITWIGEVSGRRIEGHYVVQPSGFNVLLNGGEKQQGVWSVQR